MKVLVTQPQACGGSHGHWERVAKADAWVVLGGVQYTPKISNGDGTARKTGQGHIRLPDLWAGVGAVADRSTLWETRLRRGKSLEVLSRRVQYAMENQPRNGFWVALLETLSQGTLGESSLAAAIQVKRMLGIGTAIIPDYELEVFETNKATRIISLAKAVGATTILAGQTTLKYLGDAPLSMSIEGFGRPSPDSSLWIGVPK